METGVPEDISQVVTKPDGSREYRISDHLASLRVTVDAGGTDSYDYDPWGTPLQPPVTGDPRRTYNDREQDMESGDYNLGVRQYLDDEGRFQSIDPHWERYPSWTPYQYAAGNPVNNTDRDGKDVIILNDKDAVAGFGHNGMLVGNDKIGWRYYSKDGAVNGVQKYTRPMKAFKSVDEFLQSSYADRYQHGIVIKTTEYQDGAAQKFADEDYSTGYDLLANNCADLIDKTLKSIGIEIRGDDGLGVTVPNSQAAQAIYSGLASDIIHINHHPDDDPPSRLLAPNPYNRGSVYSMSPNSSGR